MLVGENWARSAAGAKQTARGAREPIRQLYGLVGRLLAGEAVGETVATERHFDFCPEAMWESKMFYEELSGKPPLLLRALLPCPIRTEGDKTRVGAMVRCAYSTGDLFKRITAVEPPYFLQFEVTKQHLGIEGCVEAVDGSYRIRRSAGGSEVVLTTNYRAYLRPRWAWRPLERLLVGTLHGYILDGILASVARCG